MAERTFLIQRYCADMHPHVRGERPFIVAGPTFAEWVVPGSIERTGQHLLRREIRGMLHSAFLPGGIHQRHYQHEAIAELLLREGVVQALWSIDSAHCLPDKMRWAESIRQVMREIPFTSGPPSHQFWETEAAVSEYLSGMPTAAMAREYVSEDHLALEVMVVPVG